MPIFTRRRFQPRLTLSLYRYRDLPESPQENKDAITKALDDQKIVDKFSAGAFRIFKKLGVFDRPEFVAAMATADTVGGDHPFLEMIWAAFLEYLPELIALLLSLL